jgi:Aspartyl protease
MKNTYSIILILTTIICNGQTLKGYYSGINKQDIGQEYPVEILVNNLEKEEVSGAINYNTLKCGGSLVYIGSTFDKRYFFKEIITQNESDCVTNGIVVLQPLNENQLVFYWYYEDGRLGSATVLNKDSNIESKNISNCNSLIKLYKSNSNLFEIVTEINNVLKISFILDSGASEISLTPDFALTLIRTGTISAEDWLEGANYKFADGSVAKSKRFRIKTLKIGDNI